MAKAAAASDGGGQGGSVREGTHLSAIQIHVEGEPVTQGSLSALINKKTGRPYVTNKTKKDLQPYRTAICYKAKSIMRGKLLTGPVQIEIEFVCKRPAKPTFGWPQGDLDKYARSVLDALTGAVYDDDKRVVTLIARKKYATSGGPFTLITVRPILEAEVSSVRIEK